MTSPGTYGLLAILALGACETPPPAPRLYPVLIRAASEDGDALAKIEIVSRDKVIGKTDSEGVLFTKLQGEEGMDFTFTPRCPQGAKPMGAAPAIRLRTLGAQARPEVEVTCGRDQRIAALLVSTPGFEGLPVLVHDRQVGRTDATGTAHVLLQGDPSTPLRVVLDTSSVPDVQPASPHRDLQIGTRDEIIVFAPALTRPPKKLEPKKKKHVAEAPPPPPVVLRPERLR